jgi:hypothetical protein
MEYQFTTTDAWSKRLFLAVLRRYDLKPYRYRALRRTTVTVNVSKRLVDETLWPHYQRAAGELRQHLDEVASRVIEGALDANCKEPEEREQPQRILAFDAPSLMVDGRSRKAEAEKPRNQRRRDR